MSDVVNLLQKDEPSIFVGPFTTNKVKVDGRIIPGLTGFENENYATLIVDGRFCIDVPKEYVSRVAWLVAQALAIGAGYPHLGAETKEQPFAPIAVELPSQEIGS